MGIVLTQSHTCRGSINFWSLRLGTVCEYTIRALDSSTQGVLQYSVCACTDFLL